MGFFSNDKKRDYHYYKDKVKEYEVKLGTIINAMLEAELAEMLGLYEYLGSQYNETVIEYYDAVDKMNQHMTGCRRHPVFSKDYKQEFRLYVPQGEE